MASLDKKDTKNNVSDDAQLVTMMGMSMLDKGGLQVIQQALQSSQDPGQVVGSFLTQLIGQMAEYTAQTLQIDPGVYVEPNGFLDQILDYIERKLGLPKEFSDQVYGETLEMIKAAAMDPAAAQGGPPMAADGAPAGPQQLPPGTAAQAPSRPGLDQGVM
jgi:hypothetical protein